MNSIVTWNVNSVRKREPLILQMIKEYKPTFICLQETKCINEQFPQIFFDEGYNIYCHGQKSYNGVAILSKISGNIISTKLPEYEYEEARFIKILADNKIIYSVYVTNGQQYGAPAYYKQINFLKSLKEDIKASLSTNSEVMICGDFNIAPKDEHADFALRSSFLCDPTLRQLWFEILELGLHDTFPSEYTWWDYRYKGMGARIDCILTSKPLTECAIIKDFRFNVESPSDHTCLIGQF